VRLNSISLHHQTITEMKTHHITYGEIEMVNAGENTSHVYVFSKEKEMTVSNDKLCTEEEYKAALIVEAEKELLKYRQEQKEMSEGLAASKWLEEKNRENGKKIYFS
jgi:hypothetical protein